MDSRLGPPPSSIPADLSELEAFRARHPDVRQIDVLIADASGILRGKKIPAERLDRLFEAGVTFPGSIFGTDVTGSTVEETGLGLSEGDADRTCLPIPDTLDLVPWTERPTGQVMLGMRDHDDTPFFADPRTVLAGVVERFRAMGLRPVIAIELEFYLIDRERGPDGLPRPPVSPLTGRRQSTTQVYGIDELYDFDGLLAAIYDACRAQEIPVDSVVSEYAPGQYEINLHHIDDAVAACDDAVLLKRAVKAVALRQGVEATFMAKPYPDLAGSGMHVHLSLLDADGNNLFADPSPHGSPALQWAIGGLAETVEDGIALFAPNQNAFRRFQRHSYAPNTAAWAHNNRSVALRVPYGPAADRRVEHRVAGADANPYLVAAAVLAGAHWGMTRRIDPGPPVTGNAYDLDGRRFTSSWVQAIERLEANPVYADYLGRRFLDVYLSIKREERDHFFATITPLEYELYLSKV